MHKVFGTKEDHVYTDREGAYLIPVRGDMAGVVRTLKGYFFVGGGIESGESHISCIERECAEEAGYTVSVKGEVCSAETYCFHNEIGFFHPIQTYYVGEIVSKKAEPTEKDHEFLWVKYSDIKGKMYWEMQNWALDNVFGK
ncbi:MAG: NUDIX domain-containing protein [Ruminococcus sp.]|uniref:NUDIX domain-containing protein n=1 Tax=Ruminococcus sp. TaxID=41978 RepID=UPI0025EF6864|nr:NUDIX domain-containing protein [Ruminococcus sp.]MCR4794319.1 NUDIX domain-containing protein [Ruminococcus sp.]